jgi:hypothetical protein
MMRARIPPSISRGVAAGAVMLAVAVPALAATAASITATKGTPQSAKINTAFAKPLVAHVADAHGHPIAGLAVRFTAPSTGASAKFANGTTTAIRKTNLHGNAKATLTANGIVGSYKVTANLKTGPLPHPAVFSLTNTR